MKLFNLIILTLVILICNIGLTSAHASSPQNLPMTHDPPLYATGGLYIGNTATCVFHKSSCAYIKKIKNKVYFNSKNEAVNMGYRPCKCCKPKKL